MYQIFKLPRVARGIRIVCKNEGEIRPFLRKALPRIKTTNASRFETRDRGDIYITAAVVRLPIEKSKIAAGN